MVVQPITDVVLAWQAAYDLSEGWIVLSILLDIVTGVSAIFRLMITRPDLPLFTGS